MKVVTALAGLTLAASVAGPVIAAERPSAPMPRRTVSGPVSVRATQAVHEIAGQYTFRLAMRASHIALHWPGGAAAEVRVAFSRDGFTFGAPVAVGLSEPEQGDLETYSDVIVAEGAIAVRVMSDRRLRLTLVALDSRDHRVATRDRRSSVQAVPMSTAPTGGVAHPAVITREQWGADESLRFDGFGKPIKRLDFWPVQRLIVHHTAGRNGDPDPAATIRATYYFHTVVRGWGDIGYNFLIDESGNVYEGRYSREYDVGEIHTGENRAGDGVQGAHAGEHNRGSIGVALLGTFMTHDATPAARAALERLLAAKAARHGIDPLGSGIYHDPLTGSEETLDDIAGHRDVNATSCPGDLFYATLPALRQSVASLIGSTFYQTVPYEIHVPASGGRATFAISITRRQGFSRSIDLDVSGIPDAWSPTFSEDPVAGSSPTLTVDVPASAPNGVRAFTIKGRAGTVIRTSHVAISKGSVADSERPHAVAPTVSVMAGSEAGPTTRVLVRWNASDDSGPNIAYTLQESVSDGAWHTVQLESERTRQRAKDLKPDHTYRYRVRATDVAGNVSSWATGPRFSTRMVQETSNAVTYSGAWSHVPGASSSGGYSERTTEAGATATFHFTGRGIAWVATKGQQKGRADVEIDGVRIAIVDLAAGPLGPRRVAFIRSWMASGPHTMTITARPSGGHPLIEVDAFVILT